MRAIKKSYIRLICVELILLIALFALFAGGSRIGGLWFSLGLGAALGVSILLFGLERNNKRYKKDFSLDIIEYSIVALLLFYISGLFVDFVRTHNYFSLEGIINVILPTIIDIVVLSLLRFVLLCKSELSRPFIISTTAIFILISIYTASIGVTFTSTQDVFLFASLYVLPAISTNIYLSYITYNYGFTPALIYSAIFGLYRIILPIAPAPNDYVFAVLKFLLPVFFFIRAFLFKAKANKGMKITPRNYNRRSLTPYIIPAVFTLVMVYFVSGYFKFYAIAIASGSMNPTFDRGAVVIVDQRPDLIEVGDIIAYRARESIIVHRIIEKNKDRDGEYFVTQGDANKSPDDIKIKRESIVGVVKAKIPIIGYPTVLLSEQ
ncbi:MAG: signal peptidase I [Candidatus Saccharibacteria bacterium]|nr:signal peptidase I [Candidatus Saccharibacteria bacterium]